MRKVAAAAGLAIAALVAGPLSACSTSGSSAPKDSQSSALPRVNAADVVADAAGPADVTRPVAARRMHVRDGMDWSEPEWVRPAANSGFFSEDASPSDHIFTRSVDQTWRQLAPTKDALVTNRTGEAEGWTFDSLDDQLKDDGPFWMRLFASATTWAPDWVARECGVHSYGPDYEDQRHLPIWNECVWSHLMTTYRQLFVDKGLRADPRLKFVYVPGAFTYAEYDYEMVTAAVKAGDLDWAAYNAWYSHAWTDLVDLFGPYAPKLVFTGEDYPWGPFTHAQQDNLAQRATAAGLGIRDGITEEFNFHLSEAPSYGSHIRPDGHMVVDESLPVHDGQHVVATENECYNACDYHTDDLAYAVAQSNLKALQLRVNWLYVVPTDSYLTQFSHHWDWVRLSIGQTATTSADAWADLRTASDTYWRDKAPPFTTRKAWRHRPWVRNVERWLVQRNVPGGHVRKARVDIHRHVLTKENGVSYEGLRTRVAHGQRGIYLDLDDRFAATTTGVVQVKVTYWDAAGDFRVGAAGELSPVVHPSGKKRWRTATLRLPAAALVGNRLRGRTDLAVRAVGDRDAVVRFVRVVRLHAPVAAAS